MFQLFKKMRSFVCVVLAFPPESVDPAAEMCTPDRPFKPESVISERSCGFQDAGERGCSVLSAPVFFCLL